jgi:ABC-type transport system involved in Fe-S cluster assembly fused permease/ATPase subunit
MSRTRKHDEPRHVRIAIDQLADQVARGSTTPGAWRKITSMTALAVVVNIGVVYMHYAMQSWFSFVVQFVPLILPAWWWMKIRSARGRLKREAPP